MIKSYVQIYLYRRVHYIHSSVNVNPNLVETSMNIIHIMKRERERSQIEKLINRHFNHTKSH